MKEKGGERIVEEIFDEEIIYTSKKLNKLQGVQTENDLQRDIS